MKLEKKMTSQNDLGTMLSALQRLGVRIEDAPTYYMRLGDSGYTMGAPLNTVYRAMASPDTEYGRGVAGIILHEITHLFRGDCLEMFKIKTKERRELANIAMDATLHLAFDEEQINQMDIVAKDYTGSPQAQSVTCDRLRKAGIDIPIFVPSYRIILSALEEEREKNSELLNKILQFLEEDVQVEDKSDLEKILSRHLDLLEKAKTEKLLKNFLEEALRGLEHNPNRGQLRFAPPDPRLARVTKLVEKINSRGSDGLREFVRNYSRPGRVEGLRGATRRYQKKVIIAIDVSGSMAELYPEAVAATRNVSHQNHVTVMLYSDKVLWTGRTVPSHIEGLGGGTIVGPTLRAAQRLLPDVLVIYTDGLHEPAQDLVLPTCPVYWILSKDGMTNNIPVRSKDRIYPAK